MTMEVGSWEMIEEKLIGGEEVKDSKRSFTKILKLLWIMTRKNVEDSNSEPGVKIYKKWKGLSWGL